MLSYFGANYSMIRQQLSTLMVCIFLEVLHSARTNIQRLTEAKQRHTFFVTNKITSLLFQWVRWLKSETIRYWACLQAGREHSTSRIFLLSLKLQADSAMK